MVLTLCAAWTFSSGRSNDEVPPSSAERSHGFGPASVNDEHEDAEGHEGSATARTAPPRTSGPGTRNRSRRGVEREHADAVRRRSDQTRPVHHREEGSRGADAGSGPLDRPTLSAQEEERRRDYLRRTVREQYFPVAKSCYEELLSRQPSASGKVVLSFHIVGDGDAGVVDQVELKEGTTLDDPEFALCMRESMYTSIFEPPPPGANETTVVYPIELSP